jgi:hypothetical protein
LQKKSAVSTADFKGFKAPQARLLLKKNRAGRTETKGRLNRVGVYLPARFFYLAACAWHPREHQGHDTAQAAAFGLTAPKRERGRKRRTISRARWAARSPKGVTRDIPLHDKSHVRFFERSAELQIKRPPAASGLTAIYREPNTICKSDGLALTGCSSAEPVSFRTVILF